MENRHTEPVKHFLGEFNWRARSLCSLICSAARRDCFHSGRIGRFGARPSANLGPSASWLPRGQRINQSGCSRCARICNLILTACIQWRPLVVRSASALVSERAKAARIADHNCALLLWPLDPLEPIRRQKSIARAQCTPIVARSPSSRPAGLIILSITAGRLGRCARAPVQHRFD